MVKKGKGLIRPNVNIQPEEPADIVSLDQQPAKKESTPENKKKKRFKNQEEQIKCSIATKEEFTALKTIRKIRFDYEMLDILIDSYVNDLSSVEKRKFKALTDD